jgi:putative membrane protein
MNSKIRSIALAGAMAAGALFLCGPAAHAQTGRMPQNPAPYPDANGGNTTGTSPGNMPDTTANTVSDTDFAKDAAEGGMMEVKLGQLAQDKGSSDAVKNFGKRMVDDHSAANEKLKGVADQESVNLPTELNRHDQQMYDKLSKLSGDAFDRAYAKDMVRDHQDDIAAFQQEANNGRDPQIKTFATNTLPTLQDHLKMARDMQRSVNGSSPAKGGSGNIQ